MMRGLEAMIQLYVLCLSTASSKPARLRQGVSTADAGSLSKHHGRNVDYGDLRRPE
jgi:hypothetical protein